MNEELNVSQEEILFTLHDEEGNEVLYRKILDFVNPENNKNYYILTENISEEEEEIEIFPMIFIKGENGEEDRFEPLTTDEEWDMVEQVVGALYASDDNEESHDGHDSSCQCGMKH